MGFSIADQFRGARASRVLASASSRSRTLTNTPFAVRKKRRKRLFRRDAETSTRDARAPRKMRCFSRLSLSERGEDEGEGFAQLRFESIFTLPLSFGKGEATRQVRSCSKVSVKV